MLPEQYETSYLFYVTLSFLCNIICYLISVFVFSFVTLSGATTYMKSFVLVEINVNKGILHTPLNSNSRSSLPDIVLARTHFKKGPYPSVVSVFYVPSVGLELKKKKKKCQKSILFHFSKQYFKCCQLKIYSKRLQLSKFCFAHMCIKRRNSGQTTRLKHKYFISTEMNTLNRK